MEISIQESEELINIDYNNEKIVFFKNTINIIFIYDDNKIKTLVLNNISRIKDFEKNKNNCIKYLLLIYEFNNDENILKYFKENYDFNFFNYINLDMYWYALIYRYNSNDYIYEEKIFTEIKEKIFVNLEINLESPNVNQYKNLKKEINSFEHDIKVFSNDIKNTSLEEVNNRKRQIYVKYNNLEQYIESLQNRYDIISNRVKAKMEDIKKLNLNISKIKNKKNSSVDILLEEKKNYLNNLLNFIEITEDKKSKSLKSLNNLNSMIDNKKNNISILDKEIVELNNKKINYHHEISKLKNQNERNYQNTRNLAVMVHVYNLDIWNDIYSYLKNLSNREFDLYINLAANENSIFKTEKYRDFINNLNNVNISQNIYLTFSDNKGMDIGGFIISYLKMIDLGLNYNSIIKIHTKSNDNWRFAMLYALLGTETIINNNLELIKKNTIGMIGNDLIPLQSIVNINSFRYINIYMNIFNIQYNNQGHFVPGTIFWIKGSILKKYFDKNKLYQCYNSFQKDYCGSKENIKEGRPHSFERFFGMLVESSGKKSIRFDSNPQDYI